MPSFYDAFSFHQDPAKRVGWHDRLNQHLKFALVEELVASSPYSTPRVIDLGSGLGDLFSFLNEASFSGSYVGIESDNTLFSASVAKHPNATFIKQNFIEAPFHDADIAVCIGGLLSHHPPTLKAMLAFLESYSSFVLIGLSSTGASSAILEDSFVGIPDAKNVLHLSQDEVAILHGLKPQRSALERLENLILSRTYATESIARAYYAIGERKRALRSLETCKTELADAMRSAWK